MIYRIHDPHFFMQHAKEDIEKIYVPIGQDGFQTRTKLFNRKMLKYCNGLIEGVIDLDQNGSECIIINDPDVGQTWYFYEGWFSPFIETSIKVRRNGRNSKGFQLCIK